MPGLASRKTSGGVPPDDHVDDVDVGASVVLDDGKVLPLDAQLGEVLLQHLDRRRFCRRGPVVVHLQLRLGSQCRSSDRGDRRQREARRMLDLCIAFSSRALSVLRPSHSTPDRGIEDVDLVERQERPRPSRLASIARGGVLDRRAPRSSASGSAEEGDRLGPDLLDELHRQVEADASGRAASSPGWREMLRPEPDFHRLPVLGRLPPAIVGEIEGQAGAARRPPSTAPFVAGPRRRACSSPANRRSRRRRCSPAGRRSRRACRSAG